MDVIIYVVTIRTEVIFCANKCNIFVRHTEVYFHANNMIYWVFFARKFSFRVNFVFFKVIRKEVWKNKIMGLYHHWNSHMRCINKKNQYRVMFMQNWRRAHTVAIIFKPLKKTIAAQWSVIVRRAGLLWSQQDFEWWWSVPLSSASLY